MICGELKLPRVFSDAEMDFMSNRSIQIHIRAEMHETENGTVQEKCPILFSFVINDIFENVPVDMGEEKEDAFIMLLGESSEQNVGFKI